MTAKRKKKNKRMRGGQTHGWGAKKKHRGGGSRGGRGMAGTGKRAGTRQPSIWGIEYFGKRGFKKKNKIMINPINIKTVEESISYWADRKLIEIKKDMYVIDLGKLGYNKLIGSGSLTKKVEIKVERATPGAIEAVKQNDGNVEITLTVEEPEKPEKKGPHENAG